MQAVGMLIGHRFLLASDFSRSPPESIKIRLSRPKIESEYARRAGKMKEFQSLYSGRNNTSAFFKNILLAFCGSKVFTLCEINEKCKVLF